MIRQDVHFNMMDWDVTLFYNAKPYDASEIMRCLWNNGISPEKYWEAQMLLRSGRRNEGLTCTKHDTTAASWCLAMFPTFGNG